MAAFAVSFVVNFAVAVVLTLLGAPLYFVLAVVVTLGALIGLAGAL